MKPTTITSQDDQAGQGEGHGDLARTVNQPGTMPKKLQTQHEDEQREDEGEELQPVFARRRMDHVGDEFVGQLRPSTARGTARAGARLPRQRRGTAPPPATTINMRSA